MPAKSTPHHLYFKSPSPYELFLPEGNGPFPLVCVTPLLGRLVLLEDLFLERWFAKFFAAQGIAAAVMARPIFEFNPARGLEQLQEYLEQSVNRNRGILSALTEHGKIDRSRIGTLGISFGAIVNSLWANSDPRLKTHVLALGGGNLAEIFVTSRDPLMRSYFKDALQSQGCRPEELKLRLEKIFSTDPLKTAGSLAKEKTLLILAMFDRVIRFQYGMSLRRVMQNPETVFLPFGHYTAILGIPFLRWKILRFFRNNL